MDLNALREFDAVIREGSFAAAARRLGRPKSTVSKRVQDLEADLGVRLIERTTRNLRLTEAGALVLSRARRILADADELTAAVGLDDRAVAGHLRIAAPLLFGQVFMGQIAAACRRLYPDLTLQLVLTDGRPDPAEDGFDAAIVEGRPEDDRLLSHAVAETRDVAIAAPEIAPVPLDDPSGLTDLPVLVGGAGLIESWTFLNGRREVVVRVASGLSIGALRGAAIGGAGVALLPLYAVQDDLSAGRLVPVLSSEWARPPVPVRLVHPGGEAFSVRLGAFLEVLRAAFPSGLLEQGLHPAPPVRVAGCRDGRMRT